MNKKQKKMLARILIAAAMLIALKLIPVTGILQLALYLVVYGIIGYDILKKAWKGILNRQVFDENFLMAVATIGAFALAIYERSGDYVEAIAVMLFYQIGELFQSYAVGKSRRNISALVFRLDMPERITPSSGTFSPGCTTMMLPTATSSGSTCSNLPSFSMLA